MTSTMNPPPSAAEKGEKLIEPAVAGVTSILEKMIAGQEIDLPPATFRPEGRIHMVTGKPA